MKPNTDVGADLPGGISLGTALTEEQAEDIYNQGKEAVVFALLEMSKKLAEQQSPPTPAPSTPSGMCHPIKRPLPKAVARKQAEKKAILGCDAIFRTTFITKKSPGKNWPAFAKKLRRLMGDAIRLWRNREEFDAKTFASRRHRLTTRLQEMIDTDWKDA